jgi:hypothetical protein
LRGILDVTGFAVNAVLRVDLKTRAAWFLNYFVHAGRAVTLSRFGIQREILRDRDFRILQLQVAGLVFLMIGARQEY